MPRDGAGRRRGAHARSIRWRVRAARSTRTDDRRDQARPTPLPDVYAAESALVARVSRCIHGSTTTVLRAPGGSGETTLARAVVDALCLPWAWITLDEWDDGSRLVELLHEALTRAGIDLAEPRRFVTGTSTTFSIREAATIVVNGMLDAVVEPVVLVLDDVPGSRPRWTPSHSSPS